MAVCTRMISVRSRGDCDVTDITSQVAEAVEDSGLLEGLVHVFVTGSTAGVTTIEFESGLLSDVKGFFERIAPQGDVYAHNERWHDGNGHSHVRASLLGPSICVPVIGGKMTLGAWQQIVLVDFDNRPRNRELVVQVIGE